MGPHPLRWGRDCPLETRSYAMCATKFGRFRSNRLGASMGPNFLWDAVTPPPWDRLDTWLTLRNLVLPTCDTMLHSVILGQTVRV